MPYPNARLEILTSASALATRAAEFFMSSLDEAIGNHGQFVVALSGGRTPLLFNEAIVDLDRKADPQALSSHSSHSSRPCHALESSLVSPAAAHRRWARVHVLYADERAVPVEHEANNHRMTHRTLLSRIAIPPENVHRIEADDGDHVRAARDYSELIEREYEHRIDLIVLGMGDDGHTASLFPVHDDDRKSGHHDQDGDEHTLAGTDGAAAIPTFAPRGAPVLRRVSLSYASIADAGVALVLVSGASKASRFAEVWTQEGKLPLQRVLRLRAMRGHKTCILIDRDAGSELGTAAHEAETASGAGSS
ncbi:MAG: 6-phosphogluconolactonase [Deltaproteobacteria bacterium]|nr:6-phosphogluconolactonase [Deltaproteobacteria bacterium]